MLEVENIDVSYGDLEVLHDISLRVGEKGETVGIFGPNGHGKTTILRAISGLVHPSKGSIRFNGTRIDKMPPHKIVELGIVQIPQGAGLFPNMTVEENLRLGAYAKSAWKRRSEKLKEVYELFPKLLEKKNQFCRTLSGGEKQMVGIGRGLASAAKLLMMDEPSFGLAPKLADEVIEKIKEIKKMSISIVVVEQNVRFITELTERVYLVEKGKIVLSGDTKNVCEMKEVGEIYLGRKA